MRDVDRIQITKVYASWGFIRSLQSNINICYSPSLQLPTYNWRYAGQLAGPVHENGQHLTTQCVRTQYHSLSGTLSFRLQVCYGLLAARPGYTHGVLGRKSMYVGELSLSQCSTEQGLCTSVTLYYCVKKRVPSLNTGGLAYSRWTKTGGWEENVYNYRANAANWFGSCSTPSQAPSLWVNSFMPKASERSYLHHNLGNQWTFFWPWPWPWSWSHPAENVWNHAEKKE